jgi:hypothetical protein
MCRDWRAAFDAAVTRLTCVAPDPPPPDAGGGCGGGGGGDCGVGVDGGVAVAGGDAAGSTGADAGGGVAVGGGGGGRGAAGVAAPTAAAASTRAARLPLAFERAVACEVDGIAGERGNAALRRVVAALAAGSPALSSLRVADCGGVTGLPHELSGLAALARLTVHWTALAALPPGLERLERLTVRRGVGEASRVVRKPWRCGGRRVSLFLKAPLSQLA